MKISATVKNGNTYIKYRKISNPFKFWEFVRTKYPKSNYINFYNERRIFIGRTYINFYTKPNTTL